MPTHMELQYLLGLSCLRRFPDADEITVGDMVFDVAAKKVRDVDVTVTIPEQVPVIALRAFELKDEAAPLDVATVEQLSQKLQDMPQINERVIVSTSGFTDGASAKAQAHGVQLLHMKPWTAAMREQFSEFRDAGPVTEFFREFLSTLLIWKDWKLYFVTPTHRDDFRWQFDTTLFDVNGKIHDRFPTCRELGDDVLLRSTERLIGSEPAQTLFRELKLSGVPRLDTVQRSSPLPLEHEVPTTDEGVFLRLGSSLVQVASVVISGDLLWESRKRAPEPYILEDYTTGKAFAGAIVVDLAKPTGEMLALLFAPDSRVVEFHRILLERKHKNQIRQLTILQKGALPR
jgi:restriction endonuclease